MKPVYLAWQSDARCVIGLASSVISNSIVIRCHLFGHFSLCVCVQNPPEQHASGCLLHFVSAFLVDGAIGIVGYAGCVV